MNGNLDEYELAAKKLNDAVHAFADRRRPQRFTLEDHSNHGGNGGYRSASFLLSRRDDIGGEFKLLEFSMSYYERATAEEPQVVNVSMHEQIFALGSISRYARAVQEKIPLDALSEVAFEHSWVRLDSQIHEAKPA